QSHLPSPFGTGEPARGPSGPVPERYWPPVLPSRMGWMAKVTLSPGFKVPGRHPTLTRCSGLDISMLHSASLPPSVLTSSWMKTWGLVQRKSLTVPCSVTDFDWSNIANEWCASAELAVSIAATAMRAQFSTLLICSSTDPEYRVFLHVVRDSVVNPSRPHR